MIVGLLQIIGNDILTNPAFLLGLMSLVGLVALKKPINKLITGTLKPILGFIMLGAGADFIVKNLDYLGKMIEKGFNITGVVPNNEAIVSIAQKVLGKETMFILVAGLIINILIARFTKFKYIFFNRTSQLLPSLYVLSSSCNNRIPRWNASFSWRTFTWNVVSYISSNRSKIYRLSY